MKFLIFFYCFSILMLLVFGDLENKLKKWDVINFDDVIQDLSVRKKRSSNAEKPFFNKMSLVLFEKHFQLILSPFRSLFTSNFEITVFDKIEVSSLDMDTDLMMKGTVENEPNSSVILYITNETLMAKIESENENYFVEPLWRHVPQVTNKKQLLVYRASDVNLTDVEEHLKYRKTCGLDLKKQTHFGFNNSSNHKDRQKRSFYSSYYNKKVCTIGLYVDYRFYKNMGNNEMEIIYYLASHIASVNKVYQSTNWGESFKNGVSIQIEKIIIYKSEGSGPAFNQKKTWTASDLLSVFSLNEHPFCLAHLFTFMTLERGVIGLAYVAEVDKSSSFEGQGGGICSKPPSRFKTPYWNTGFTTFLSYKRNLLSIEAVIVTVHEIGHNFGAFHDDLPECTPGVKAGGNFVMYPASVSGKFQNNLKFSPCSIRNVYSVLLQRSSFCFEEVKENICGNFLIDPLEECDSGYHSYSEHHCCTADCKLKPSAKCSPYNHMCCTDDCQIAKTSKICRNYIPGLCQQEEFCDGVHLFCPNVTYVDDGEDCGGDGKCRNGSCLSFCATIGLKDCFCDELEFQCARCCSLPAVGENETTICQPYLYPNKSIKYLTDNSRCMFGYCEEGKCVRITQDLIERIFSVLAQLSPNQIVEFIKENIVGAIAVFAFIFWLPLSLLISYVDRLQKRIIYEEKKMYLDDLDKRLPHYPVASLHGFNLRTSETKHINERIRWT